jgi:membrane protease YdiL (CAAX protease family)
MFGLSELNNLLVEFLTKLGFTVSEVTLPPKTPLNVCLIIIFVCVVPAVMEEVFFRGLIINGLYKTGSVFACLMSGLLFSLFHMSPAQTIYQFIVGVIYALIVLHGGNYILTIISHLFNNLFIVLNYYFFNFYPVGELKVVLTILGLICLALGLFFVYSNKKEIPALEKKSNFFKSIPFGIIFCVVMWVIGLFSNG